MQFDEKPKDEEGTAPTSPDTATPAPAASGAADDEANSAVAMLIRNTDKIPVRREGGVSMTAAANTKCLTDTILATYLGRRSTRW